jgi:anti-sigma factor RsiW
MTASRNNVVSLLPFYANRTLDAEDRARVEAALAEDTGLGDDLRALEQLRDTMQGMDVGPTPGEFGLARLLRDVDREAARAPARPVLPWGIAAAAVVGAVAMGIVWLSEPGDPTFRQASGGADATLLTVAFRPDATEAEISALLQTLGLEIAGGPTAIGLYRIRPTEGADAAATVEALRAETGVVESADLP